MHRANIDRNPQNCEILADNSVKAGILNIAGKNAYSWLASGGRIEEFVRAVPFAKLERIMGEEPICHVVDCVWITSLTEIVGKVIDSAFSIRTLSVA